jgi:hypothetical protein
MRLHIKIVWGVMLLVAALLSRGCRVPQEVGGASRGCGNYQAPAGPDPRC